jgi:hypothetical protein
MGGACSTCWEMRGAQRDLVEQNKRDSFDVLWKNKVRMEFSGNSTMVWIGLRWLRVGISGGLL